MCVYVHDLILLQIVNSLNAKFCHNIILCILWHLAYNFDQKIICTPVMGHLLVSLLCYIFLVASALPFFLSASNWYIFADDICLLASHGLWALAVIGTFTFPCPVLCTLTCFPKLTPLRSLQNRSMYTSVLYSSRKHKCVNIIIIANEFLRTGTMPYPFKSL